MSGQGIINTRVSPANPITNPTLFVTTIKVDSRTVRAILSFEYTLPAIVENVDFFTNDGMLVGIEKVRLRTSGVTSTVMLKEEDYIRHAPRKCGDNLFVIYFDVQLPASRPEA